MKESQGMFTLTWIKNSGGYLQMKWSNFLRTTPYDAVSLEEMPRLPVEEREVVDAGWGSAGVYL